MVVQNCCVLVGAFSWISYGNKTSSSFCILAKTAFVGDKYFKIKMILQVFLKNIKIKEFFFAKERDSYFARIDTSKVCSSFQLSRHLSLRKLDLGEVISKTSHLAGHQSKFHLKKSQFLILLILRL